MDLIKTLQAEIDLARDDDNEDEETKLSDE